MKLKKEILSTASLISLILILLLGFTFTHKQKIKQTGKNYNIYLKNGNTYVKSDSNVFYVYDLSSIHSYTASASGDILPAVGHDTAVVFDQDPAACSHRQLCRPEQRFLRQLEPLTQIRRQAFPFFQCGHLPSV